MASSGDTERRIGSDEGGDRKADVNARSYAGVGAALWVGKRKDGSVTRLLLRNRV